MVSVVSRDVLEPGASLARSGADGGASTRRDVGHRENLDRLRLAALSLMHVGCLGVFWVGYSWIALTFALGLYLVRAFALTAFYHRYFAHRAFKTSRWFQFCGALLGCMALQKGPLWWAAHHRQHHRKSDQEGDLHSPRLHGFVWAHLGWFLTPTNLKLRANLIRDWSAFAELRWLDRCSPLVAALYALGLFGVGELLRILVPSLHASGPQLVVWGFFISTVALYHVTYSVNSVGHLFGSRRFPTTDDSRNNAVVALLTLGEGWHNNHHFYPWSARSGLDWWEIDVTFYVLVALEKLGLVWDLKSAARASHDRFQNQPRQAARP